MRKKREATYKQMAFDTSLRNPERFIGILKALKEFDGTTLNDENLLKIVSKLYLVGEVTSSKIATDSSLSFENIKDEVIEVNSTRKADGGFPQGYQSRFWTYMRGLSELGFVYARYNREFKLSQIAKKLIVRDIDEQEAFSIQAVKYNRKSPYRNVSNDFNFFTFILKVLLELRKKGSSLSYEQFIVAMFSRDGDVEEFLNILSNNKFKDYDTTYYFIKNNYDINTNFKTTMQDYPDVVRRFFIISGFISIRYSGKKLIQINENKLDYINELLTIDFKLSYDEKESDLKYFNRLNEDSKKYLNIIQKYRSSDKIDGNNYTNKIFDIIKNYNIDEDIIIQSIHNIDKNRSGIEEFKEIPKPLKLEFFISILIALKYGKEFTIRPNYKADHIGKPYSHAPGNMGDIEVYSETLYWLIEVTLIRNKTQQLNHETTSVIRHLTSNEEFDNHHIKYLSFVAPYVHLDTKEFFDISVIKSKKEDSKIYLKPYSIDDFTDITIEKKNFNDMKEYTAEVFSEFKKLLG